MTRRSLVVLLIIILIVVVKTKSLDLLVAYARALCTLWDTASWSVSYMTKRLPEGIYELQYYELQYCEIHCCEIRYCEIHYCEIQYCEIQWWGLRNPYFIIVLCFDCPDRPKNKVVNILILDKIGLTSLAPNCILFMTFSISL